MCDLLAKKNYMSCPKIDKTRALTSKRTKVINSESEANTLPFLSIRSKKALAPQIFELDL